MITGGLITTTPWIIPLFMWLIIGSIIYSVIKGILEWRYNKKYRKGIEEGRKASKMKNGDDWYW